MHWAPTLLGPHPLTLNFFYWVSAFAAAFAAAFGSLSVENPPLPLLTFQTVNKNFTID